MLDMLILVFVVIVFALLAYRVYSTKKQDAKERAEFEKDSSK